MADGLDNGHDEEKHRVIKMKVTVKKNKKDEVANVGIIDKTKFSIFGEVLADKKKNRLSLVDDEEDSVLLLLQRKKKQTNENSCVEQKLQPEKRVVQEAKEIINEIEEEKEEKVEEPIVPEEQKAEEPFMPQEPNVDTLCGIEEDDDNTAKSIVNEKALLLQRKLEEKKEKQRREGRLPGALHPDKVAKFGSCKIDLFKRSMSISSEYENRGIRRQKALTSSPSCDIQDSNEEKSVNQGDNAMTGSFERNDVQENSTISHKDKKENVDIQSLSKLEDGDAERKNENNADDANGIN